jgi:serine protease Do
MFKKILLFSIGLLFIVLLIVLIQIFIVPRLLQTAFLQKYHFLKEDSEKTIVINKTEKVTVKEDFSLAKTGERVASGVVKIMLVPEKKNTKINLNSTIQTGVVLSGDGIVVTVLSDDLKKATEKNLRVLLNDERIFKVEKVFKDDFNELLFLKIKADNLVSVPFGNSRELENGEKIILIGSVGGVKKPIYGLNIIRNYTLNFNKEGRQFLFSDKNSSVFILNGAIGKEFIGAPAVDFNGTIVGLANVVQNVSGRYDFFIPIVNIEKSLRKLIENDEISYPKLGTYYFNLTEELSLLNNISEKEGAFVYTPSGRVTLAQSAGRIAGLKYGDIILAVNEEKIGKGNNLAEILSDYRVGDKITLRIVRQGKEMSLPLTLK